MRQSASLQTNNDHRPIGGSRSVATTNRSAGASSLQAPDLANHYSGNGLSLVSGAQRNITYPSKNASERMVAAHWMPYAARSEPNTQGPAAAIYRATLYEKPVPVARRRVGKISGKKTA